MSSRSKKRGILEAAAAGDPLAERLVSVLAQPTGISSAGFRYLQQSAWETFRDRVPHLLGMGQRVLDVCDKLNAAFDGSAASAEEKKALSDASAVVRQVALTAAITAPPDLWLMRHVLGAFAALGLLRRLLEGEALYPECCEVEIDGKTRALDPGELDKDLHFLLSRGLVEQYDEGFRIAGHPRVRDLFFHVGRAGPVPAQIPASVTRLWRRLFTGAVLSNEELEILLDLGQGARRRIDFAQNHWIADRDELELGYRLLPVVLGLRASGRTSELVEDASTRPEEWSRPHPVVAAGALEVLAASGWMRREGESYRVTPVGGRSFSRGPGPFGIIETYHPYMQRCREILIHGTSSAHVSRGENVGASQDANRATFEQANDALDRFCGDTGFQYGVFIEHAIGRGEATRQRYARSGGALHYVGADLEDTAIDAAMEEQRRGALPANMLFVRQADIGRPDALLSALRSAGLSPEGAVMLVGNGFHEARGQTDDSMVEVFRDYHQAGFVLLFTEESALSIDDLRATAWNTYHAGFKYVHDKSGQALRPAEPPPRPARLGRPMLAPWSECARRAGYVRADRYCTRTRTVYPYRPKSGFNPSISVNHFFVPASLAERLRLRP